jgi:RNA polymerase sigma-70 factor (ECF subfamily)
LGAHRRLILHGESVLTAATVELIQPDAASLVARARGGDLSAFEGVYRMHSAQVLGVCMRMAGDRREAEELAQDAWVRAWERLGSFRGDATFGTWMHRLTVNLLLDRRRSDARWKKRLVSMEDEGPVERHAAVTAPAGARLDLERALRTLPDGARTVFLLHEVDGYKHREIAERLGVAVGTVKAQLHRARKLLQEALER